MSKVVLKGHLIVSDADLSAVLAELPSHVDNTLQESGCLIFKVARDPDSINRFNVYEEFVDQAAFKAHQARVLDSDWARVTKHAERHYEIVEPI